MKIAVVFDNRVRQDSTGSYYYWGFQRLGHETDHILPDKALEIKSHSYDFILKVDDGLKQFVDWNEVLRPCAYVCIDSFYWDSAEWRPKIAEQMDWNFCVQRNGIQFMEENGIKGKSSWLPLAADEDLHTPDINGHDRWDWSFVGNVGHSQPGKPNKRIDYLDKLLKEFPNGCISDYSYFKEMANVYGQSRIVFNTNQDRDINMRFFEGLMSGASLVTEYTDNGERAPELEDLWGQYYTYEDDPLPAVECAMQFRAQARDIMLERHCYKHRCQSMLDHFEVKS